MVSRAILLSFIVTDVVPWTCLAQKIECKTGETLMCTDGSKVDLSQKPPCKTGVPQCCVGKKCYDAPKPKPTPTPGNTATKSPTVTKSPANSGEVKTATKSPANSGDLKTAISKPAAGGGGAGQKPTPKPGPPKVFTACPRLEIDKRFKTCTLAAADDAAKKTCRAAFTTEMKDKCKQTVNDNDAKALVLQEARKKLASCQMKAKDAKAKKACITSFESLTGKKRTSTGDADKDLANDKFEAMKGAKAAIADSMNSCVKGKEAECKANLKKEMGNVAGKPLRDDEMAVMLKDAGKKEAATKIKDCISKATSLTARKACNTNADAKTAYAKAMGKDVSQIKDSDLRAAAKSQGAKDVRDTWSACRDAATTNADKKACSKGDDLKAAIANSVGSDSADIKDSKVREYLASQGKKEKLDFMKTCDKSDAAKAAKCKDLVKEMKAKDLGKIASQITDDELKKDLKQAMGKDISQRMKACTEEANKDATKLKTCRTAMQDAMQESSLDGKKPDKTQLEKVLKEGATSQAREVMSNCEKTRSECLELVKEAAASALGKGDKTAVTKGAVERMMKEGADNAAKESVKACANARKENTTASCDDAYDKFLASRKKTKPTSINSQKREKAAVMLSVQKQAVKDNLKVCAEKADKTAVDTCMAAFKAEADDLAKTAFGDNDAKKLAAKKKVADREAAVEYIGSEFDACMAAASDDTEKKACTTKLTALKQKLGMKDDASALKKKFNAKKISEGVLACDASSRKECLKDARADFKSSGNKEREFDVQKKMGQIKAAADAWAACSGEALNDTVCNGEAKTVYMAASGSDGTDWETKVLPKVSKLGKGLKDGTEVVVKKLKQLAVDTATDATTCGDATGKKILDAVKAVQTTPAITKAKARGCIVENGVAAYSTAVDTSKMDDTQSEAAADKIAVDVAKATLARRLLDRRLLAVTGVGAAVDSEMCASGDTSCGQTENFDATTTTTAKSGSGGGTTTAAGKATTTTTAAGKATTTAAGKATTTAAGKATTSGAASLAVSQAVGCMWHASYGLLLVLASMFAW